MHSHEKFGRIEVLNKNSDPSAQVSILHFYNLAITFFYFAEEEKQAPFPCEFSLPLLIEYEF